VHEPTEKKDIDYKQYTRRYASVHEIAKQLEKPGEQQDTPIDLFVVFIDNCLEKQFVKNSIYMDIISIDIRKQLEVVKKSIKPIYMWALSTKQHELAEKILDFFEGVIEKISSIVSDNNTDTLGYISFVLRQIVCHDFKNPDLSYFSFEYNVNKKATHIEDKDEEEEEEGEEEKHIEAVIEDNTQQLTPKFTHLKKMVVDILRNFNKENHIKSLYINDVKYDILNVVGTMCLLDKSENIINCGGYDIKIDKEKIYILEKKSVRIKCEHVSSINIFEGLVLGEIFNIGVCGINYMYDNKHNSIISNYNIGYETCVVSQTVLKYKIPSFMFFEHLDTTFMFNIGVSLTFYCGQIKDVQHIEKNKILKINDCDNNCVPKKYI
jgi:hypothetical protein